jgi:hypothetical protein
MGWMTRCLPHAPGKKKTNHTSPTSADNASFVHPHNLATVVAGEKKQIHDHEKR